MTLPLAVLDKGAEARALAARLGLPCVTTPQVEQALLAYGPTGLSLSVAEIGTVHVDFCAGAQRHRRLYGGGRQQPLARAVGFKPGFTPRVLDATAGLGRDAFVLASLGCDVALLERSPVVAALLADALQRAALDADTAPIAARMHWHEGDSRERLADLAASFQADTIYLDPMYPERKKSALVKKEMRLFRQVLGDDQDAPQLLAEALRHARRRVVVKRPKPAPPLLGSSPTTAIASKNTRYDIYVIP